MNVENSGGDEMEVIEEEKGDPPKKTKAKPSVYLPGGVLQEGEELVHDSSTYRMYHVVCLFCCKQIKPCVCQSQTPQLYVHSMSPACVYLYGLSKSGQRSPI